MYIQTQQGVRYFGTLLRGAICLSVTCGGLYINRISKEYYYKIRDFKNSSFVREVIVEVLEHKNKTEQTITAPNVNVERASKDCAITTNINSNLQGIAPKSVTKQLSKVLKYMGLKEGIIRMHYEGKDLKFVGLLEGKKYKNVAIKHRNGWYNGDGVQINKKYHIPDFLSLVSSKDPKKKLRISSGYGYRIHPIHKKKIFHPGIDIAGPIGSKVFAALPGKVKKIAYSKSYGTYIVIQHQGGLETFYAHLKSVDRKMSIDRPVAQGAQIGFVGQSGHATGPHLHFEVRRNKKHISPRTVNPLQLKLEGYELVALSKLHKFYAAQLKKPHASDTAQETKTTLEAPKAGVYVNSSASRQKRPNREALGIQFKILPLFNASKKIAKF
jgi:murein DD-endopeptidase MepM/ murein hydrolase activator NlpD